MSPQHYTKNTVQAAIWCNSCGKITPWRIADGRRQYCIPCYETKPRDAKTPTLAAEQSNLFLENTGKAKNV
jgi:hypothetical protein